MNGTSPSSNQPMLPAAKSSSWMWVVLVVGAIVLLALAAYVYYSGVTPPEEPAAGIGTGGDTASIEKDLQEMSLEGLDSELEDIEKELR